jgi:hypothetical protein
MQVETQYSFLVFSNPSQAIQVPLQRAEINARIIHQLDARRNMSSGNARDVDGFETQVEDIERFVRVSLVTLRLMWFQAVSRMLHGDDLCIHCPFLADVGHLVFPC